jgi:hypothetical protein
MTPEQAVKLLDNLSEYGLCYNITEEYQEAMKLVLSMLEEKEKIIDLMTNELALYCEINCEEDIKTNKEQIRQYFEDKAST